GDGLVHARELRHHDALLLAGLVGLGRRAARQVTAAERRDRRRRQLRIGGELLRIGNRAVDGDPIALRHCGAPWRGWSEAQAVTPTIAQIRAALQSALNAVQAIKAVL